MLLPLVDRPYTKVVTLRDNARHGHPVVELTLIQTTDQRVLGFPAAVPWELAIKYHSGKLPAAEPVLTDYASILLRLGASSFPILHTHAIQTGLLAWSHRDPFDRLFAAMAIMEGLPIISKDAVFDQLPDVRRIW